MFTAGLAITAKMWKNTRCQSIDEWAKNVAYPYNEILFSNKNKSGTDHA